MQAERDYVRHLLALRRAETELNLEQQGYEAAVEKNVGGQLVDLVGTKDGKTVLYKFKLAANLRRDAKEIQCLRAIAAESGYEFKLVVVAPPKRTLVEVEGLEEALWNYLIREALPSELESLASAVYVEKVSDLNISEIEVHKDEVRAAGNGLIGVRLEYGGGQDRDGITNQDTFPFSFRVTLNRDLEVVRADEVVVNTSSFNE